LQALQKGVCIKNTKYPSSQAASGHTSKGVA